MAKGREFEEFVTRVEAVLAPEGAEVKHNDFVPDRITGELRQVDTTVRYKIDNLPVLVTIESRERAKVEDSMWIEQLVTKRNDIGAFKTIAVTSKGFSGPAVTKARHYGIELRIVSSVSASDIRSWIHSVQLNLVTQDIRFTEWQIAFHDEDPELVLAPSVEATIKVNGIRKGRFLTLSDGSPVVLNWFLNEMVDRGDLGLDKAPIDGKEHRIPLLIPFECRTAFVETNKGARDIAAAKCIAIVRRDLEQIDASKIADYSDDKRKLLQSVEWKVTKEGKITGTISAHRRADTAETIVRYVPKT